MKTATNSSATISESHRGDGSGANGGAPRTGAGAYAAHRKAYRVFSALFMGILSASAQPVISAPGTVVAWGNNIAGQVTGIPPTAYPWSAIAYPVALGGQVLSGVTAIAAASSCLDIDLDICGGYTMALKNDGSVIVWGGRREIGTTYGPNGVTNVPVAAQSGVTAIAAGPGHHFVALKRDGSVITWGIGGQTHVPVASQTGVTAIASGGGIYTPNGYGYTVALKNDGSVVVWGADLAVTTVPAAAKNGVTAIAAGNDQVVALKSDGSVIAWEVGRADTESVPVAAQSGVTAIAAAGGSGNKDNTIVALKNDGSVVVWGDSSVTNVPLPALSGVTAIAAGAHHVLALREDGTVVAWGENYWGAVTGTPNPSIRIANPVTLGGQLLSGVTAISAGLDFSLALVGYTPLLPTLNARPNGNQLILSWPTNAVGFTLQSALNLSPPVTWIDSTKSPEVIGAQFTVTNPASGHARYYRLSKP